MVSAVSAEIALHSVVKKAAMAFQSMSPPGGGCPSSRVAPRSSTGIHLLLFFTALLAFAATTSAQLQQPYVYTTGGAIATRNDVTGALAPVAGSPLPALGYPAVIDSKGRFLFAAGNNSIHMYTVDSATGTYTEVPGSPFSSANTNSPVLIATEPTGTYLGVVNSVGLNAGESSVESFQIDATGETLIPVGGSFLELVSTPVGAAANPVQGTFFIYLGPNPSSPNLTYQLDGDLLTFTIDPQTGLLGNQNGSTTAAPNQGRSFGADPLGQFVVTGEGQLECLLRVTTTGGPQGELNIGAGVIPQEIFVGPGQRFVYATLFAAPVSSVNIYIVDTATWTLTKAPSSPLPGFTSVSGLVADPTGQFVYQSTSTNQVHVFFVELATGYLTEVAGSPFTGPGLGLPIAFSVIPGTNTQNESGPVATLTPANLSFTSTGVGIPATAQTIALSSTGNQALSVNGIAITGANSSEFSETDNCGAPTVLAAANSCFISVVFTPAASGVRQAQLNVMDNGPGSPQSVLLTGSGGAPAPVPGITFSPTTVNFPSLALGTTSSPMSVMVTNSGTAPLNISTIVVGGSNPADFALPSSNCIGAAIAANASCSIAVTFTPASAGARQATVSFIDNAPGNPQVVTLTGTGMGPPVTGPAVTLSSSTVNFPSTLQGTSSAAISVTVTNSGNAPLHISSVVAGGNNITNFTNSLNACGTVAANANCTVAGVVFAPVSPSTLSETISIIDDASNSPQVINVSGTATAVFTVTSPSSALSATVTAGQSAAYNLQLTAGVGYNGAISFVCSGAPVNATCQMPSSVALTSGNSAALAVTVSTDTASAASGTLITAARRSPPLTRSAGWLPFAIAVVFYSLVFAYRRPSLTAALSRGRWRNAWAASAILCSLPIFFVLSGCGGGAGSAPATQDVSAVTPDGTSTIVLTPTASNAAGTALQLTPIQLTLVVNN
jgi:hypothetical protein